MTYATSNPPVLARQGGVDGSAPSKFLYTDADAAATVRVTGYITNGGDLGMKVGDLVEHYDTNLKITSMMNVVTVSSTAPGAVDLADATVIGSSTNSD